MTLRGKCYIKSCGARIPTGVSQSWNHPFVRGLAMGTLDTDAFLRRTSPRTPSFCERSVRALRVGVGRRAKRSNKPNRSMACIGGLLDELKLHAGLCQRTRYPVDHRSSPSQRRWPTLLFLDGRRQQWGNHLPKSSAAMIPCIETVTITSGTRCRDQLHPDSSLQRDGFEKPIPVYLI